MVIIIMDVNSRVPRDLASPGKRPELPRDLVDQVASWLQRPAPSNSRFTHTYMISAANDACGNCSPPEIRLTEQATAYCAKRSKAMVVKDTKNSTFDIGFGKRVTLTFECK